MRFNRQQIVRWSLVPAALGLAIAAGGCGGSGGDNGIATPLHITGAVQAAPAGSPLSGYTIAFDKSAKYAATTDASGAFTLYIQRTDVSGADTLTVKDPSGILVDNVALPASSKTAFDYNAGVLNVSPPTAPFVAH